MSVTIRIAGPSDAEAVADLLRARDATSYASNAVTHYLADFNPERITVWLAERAGQPVAMNAVYRRSLESPVGSLAAGYWAHLFVRPEARSLMVYPQLVMAMLRWAQSGGADLIYTATRQQHVADAHLKLGFFKIATIPVLVRPLRPGRLVMSRSRALLRWAGWAAPVVDASVSAGRAAIRLAGRVAAARTVQHDDRADAHLASLQSRLTGYIRTSWTASDWLARFSCTIEGYPYWAAVAPQADKPEAGVLMRIAERGEPKIRAAVVLDLIDCSVGKAHARSLLRWVEERAEDAGADAILVASPSAEAECCAYRSKGYWTSPETYNLVYRPTSPRGQAESLRDAAAWRFNFAEHDAF